MKYIIKSKRVNVRPYQRKGKYVIGHQRLDPREKEDELVAHIKELYDQSDYLKRFPFETVLENARKVKTRKENKTLPENWKEIFSSPMSSADIAGKWNMEQETASKLLNKLAKEEKLIREVKSVPVAYSKKSGGHMYGRKNIALYSLPKPGQPFMTQQAMEEMKYAPEDTKFFGVAERIKSEETVKSKEVEYVGVSPNTIKILEHFIPKEDLEGIRSIEEFSFHDFSKCKTLPKEPFRNDIEKGYQEHPDYGGMYYHDIARLVIDSTNSSFQMSLDYKAYAMFHEIGHHQWWYHITPEDAQRYENIWKREKVTDYAYTNYGEGFAEAYARYRIGKIDPQKFPETYKFCSEVFDQRRLQKKEGKNIPVGEAYSTSKEKPNLAKQLEVAFNDFARSRGFTNKVAGDYAFMNKKGKMFKLIRTRRDGTITVWEEGVGRYDLKYVVMGEPISVKGEEESTKEKLFSKLESVRVKEKALVDYPYTANVIDLLKRVEEANTFKDVRQTTIEFDDYLKRGIGWQIEGVPEAGKVFGEAYDYAMEKRKKFLNRKFDTTGLDEIIKRYEAVSKKLPENEDQKELVGHLRGIKELFEDNWKIGLYEESEFPTLKQEVNQAVKVMKRKAKKNFWAFNEKAFDDAFATVKEVH